MNKRCHVAIPKCLLEEFANEKGQVEEYNFKHPEKTFLISCKSAGVETDYYDEDAELLLSKYESELAKFIHSAKLLKKHYEKTNFFNSERNVLINFFNYQFQRSKKNLKSVNDGSLSAKVFGFFSHSDLIRIASEIGDQANILTLLKGPLFAVHFICEDDFLITNSLGFYIVVENKIAKYLVMPLSNKDGIVIQSGFDSANPYSHYILNKQICDYFNKCCIETEVAFGNGLLFGNSKYELEYVLEKNKLLKNIY